MPNFYAVRVGRLPGIYQTWSDAELAVKGHSGAQYKKFKTQAEAEAYLNAPTPSPNINKFNTTKSTHKKRAASHDVHQAAPKQSRILRFFTDTTGTPTSLPSDTPPLVIYTDGAASNNGKKHATAGIGVYFGPNDPRNVSERLTGERQTNQRAEIYAALRALEITRNEPSVEIRTDSNYVVRAMSEWIDKWKKDGWKVNVMNRDLFERLDAEVQRPDRRVRFVHTPGHCGVPGNEAADRLAVKGAQMTDEMKLVLL